VIVYFILILYWAWRIFVNCCDFDFSICISEAEEISRATFIIIDNELIVVIWIKDMRRKRFDKNRICSVINTVQFIFFIERIFVCRILSCYAIEFRWRYDITALVFIKDTIWIRTLYIISLIIIWNILQVIIQCESECWGTYWRAINVSLDKCLSSPSNWSLRYQNNITELPWINSYTSNSRSSIIWWT
jgi:hypothetical protein